MKFKVKALVAATAMVVASTANAGIEGGLNFGDFNAVGNGELFLSAIHRDDTGAEVKSYTLDLGITAKDWHATESNNNQLYAADANMLAFLNGTGTAGHTVSWNLTANANGYTGSVVVQEDVALMSTGLTNPAPINVGNFPGAFSNLQGYTNAVDLAAGDSISANNNSFLNTNPAAGSAHDSINWGNNWSGMGNTEVALGDSADFYLLQTNSAGGAGFITPYIGQWTLESDGDFSYVAEVPLPPAVWLLGSALIGLAGITRRRQAQAQATA